MTGIHAISENPYIEDPNTDFEPIDEVDEKLAEQQVESLREAIRYHNWQYYVEADPVISDQIYDELYNRLEKLEASLDMMADDSPTQRVGGEPVDAFDTVTHSTPLLSIDQSGEAADVRSFHDRVMERIGSDVTYVCEPKFDGVSLALYYEAGTLSQAVTRGNGREGDDVTRNAKTVPSIPLRLTASAPSHLVVRGELYMPKDQFQAFNGERVKKNEAPFANPRNATAGTIRQYDPSIVADRPLAFYPFEILGASTEWKTHEEQISALESFGFQVSELLEMVDSIEAAINYRDRILESRDDLNVEIDGVVIKVNQIDSREVLGTTSSHPRWAFAYKFPSRAGETVLRDIVLQVGRTGRVTPVALLDPVDVGGVTVSRASLHNPELVDELGVGIGDTVRVERAGDVIPQVIDVVESNAVKPFRYPETCPVCDSVIEREGPIARCRGGMACPSQQRRAIEHYTSRSGLDIDGFGEKTVAQLIDSGLVTDLADLYTLSVDDVKNLEGFGKRSAENLIASIESSRKPTLGSFIAALGIRDVGNTVARSIARKFDTFAEFRAAEHEEIESVSNVGPETADRIREFFKNDANQDMLDRLLSYVEPQPIEGKTGDAFADMTIVFTGSLPSYTRSEASKIVERHGGSVTSSVSGNTDLLVVGEGAGERKQTAAENNSVSTIAATDFEDRLVDVE